MPGDSDFATAESSDVPLGAPLELDVAVMVDPPFGARVHWQFEIVHATPLASVYRAVQWPFEYVHTAPLASVHVVDPPFGANTIPPFIIVHTRSGSECVNLPSTTVHTVPQGSVHWPFEYVHTLPFGCLQVVDPLIGKTGSGQDHGVHPLLVFDEPVEEPVVDPPDDEYDELVEELERGQGL